MYSTAGGLFSINYNILIMGEAYIVGNSQDHCSPIDKEYCHCVGLAYFLGEFIYDPVIIDLIF